LIRPDIEKGPLILGGRRNTRPRCGARKTLQSRTILQPPGVTERVRRFAAVEGDVVALIAGALRAEQHSEVERFLSSAHRRYPLPAARGENQLDRRLNRYTVMGGSISSWRGDSRYVRSSFCDISRRDSHVRFWHIADMPNALTNVRFWGQSGH
jgi:hypothetical protein